MSDNVVNIGTGRRWGITMMVGAIACAIIGWEVVTAICVIGGMILMFLE